MPRPRHRVETWIFDLDNTLYPRESGLLDQIDARMTAHIMRALRLDRTAADALRQGYYDAHGITVHGLVADHGIDAATFLADCHAIDLSGLRPDPRLVAALAALPGRRIVHTNGARGHAVRVLEALGLTGAFAAIHAIEDKALVPKPRPGAYAHVIAAEGIDPARAVMIEDSARNLVEPWRLGMGTVWLTQAVGVLPAHVDRAVPDLLEWLLEPQPAVTA